MAEFFKPWRRKIGVMTLVGFVLGVVLGTMVDRRAVKKNSIDKSGD